ncbi:hypothetical protein AB0395_08840 [Streptosporangium sp. NPDC051023]|uniref:hypothetical protein n=1 Tax=Streptosporangium sp. NPDC051023 TaxID=3155410 RepID=UPI00344F5771
MAVARDGLPAPVTGGGIRAPFPLFPPLFHLARPSAPGIALAGYLWAKKLFNRDPSR